MTEQWIDEVMWLVSRLEGAVEFGTHDQIQWEKEAIRAKLREVVRKAMSQDEAKRLWASTPFIDCPEGGVALVRAVEKHHNIGAE